MGCVQCKRKRPNKNPSNGGDGMANLQPNSCYDPDPTPQNPTNTFTRIPDYNNFQAGTSGPSTPAFMGGSSLYPSSLPMSGAGIAGQSLREGCSRGLRCGGQASNACFGWASPLGQG